ncbi:hypothetical protein Vi05172_g13014 [Venturia inaequalis]|nr:hypothetical protein Vi05172_g13014 [Venturia inaequalis]
MFVFIFMSMSMSMFAAHVSFPPLTVTAVLIDDSIFCRAQ